MKTKIAAMMVMMILMVGSLIAKDVAAPPSIPLTKPALKAYALTQVDTVQVGVYGRSIANYGSYTDVPYLADDADPENMRRMASTIRLYVGAADPEDKFESYVSYQGKVGEWRETLFFGWKPFMLEDGKGGYKLPADASSVRLTISDYIPFEIKNLQSAVMYIYDQNGNLIDVYNFDNDYRQDGDVIYLGAKHMDQNGKLYVDLKDGTRWVYNLPGAKLQTSVSFELTDFKNSIQGIRSLPDNAAVIGYVTVDEIVRVGYTTKTAVQIHFPNNLKRYPSMVYIIDSKALDADPLSEWESFNPWKEAVSFEASPGQVLLIRYEYPADPREVNDRYETSNGDSGGGKG